jgi:hypothetical protein
MTKLEEASSSPYVLWQIIEFFSNEIEEKKLFNDARHMVDVEIISAGWGRMRRPQC